MERLFKLLLLFTFLISYGFSKDLTPEEIKKLIGQTIIIGFDGTKLTKSLKNDIDKYNLGGVILFNKDYKTKQAKNIINPTQLKKLTSQIQNYSKYKILISIDQEGGKVSRLNPDNGFKLFPSAKEISKKDKTEAEKEYKNLALMLKKEGFNLNFAPVVDLAKNPDNKVIVKLQRAYSKDVKEVVKYASIFIQAQKENNIYSVLKHFPGHGSSKTDSHKGFVDITKSWSQEELLPYKKLIEKKEINFIMTAHVYNKNLDEKYPATLSYKINTELLRKNLNFKGLIISDDLQMKAISNHYTLKQRIKLAINSGVNILLFGNQLDNTSLKNIVEAIYELILKKEIALSKIIESNRLINKIIDKKELQ